MDKILYIADEQLGSFYRMVDGVLEWQPMVQNSNLPNEEDWGEVEINLIGDEPITYNGKEMTLAEVYRDFIIPRFE